MLLCACGAEITKPRRGKASPRCAACRVVHHKLWVAAHARPSQRVAPRPSACLCGAPLDQSGQMPRRWCSAACRVRVQRYGTPLTSRRCLRCNSSFTPKRLDASYCTRQCGWLARASARPKNADWAAGHQPIRATACMQCAEPIVGRSSRTLCAPCRVERRAAAEGAKARRRYGAHAWPITAVAAFTDGCCHLCGDPVDLSLSGALPLGPTRDHIEPVSRGGNHDLANLRLAHRICNVRRGAQPLAA